MGDGWREKTPSMRRISKVESVDSQQSTGYHRKNPYEHFLDRKKSHRSPLSSCHGTSRSWNALSSSTRTLKMISSLGREVSETVATYTIHRVPARTWAVGWLDLTAAYQLAGEVSHVLIVGKVDWRRLASEPENMP